MMDMCCLVLAGHPARLSWRLNPLLRLANFHQEVAIVYTLIGSAGRDGAQRVRQRRHQHTQPFVLDHHSKNAGDRDNSAPPGFSCGQSIPWDQAFLQSFYILQAKPSAD
jgi:hypothetical protein